MEGIIRRQTPIAMRNYGRILQDMISYACTIENKEERQALTVYIAQCMRQKNIIWNKEQDSGLDRIKNDINQLSKGLLSCDFEGFEERFSVIRQQRPSMNFNKKKK